jgi:hypothetical protein
MTFNRKLDKIISKYKHTNSVNVDLSKEDITTVGPLIRNSGKDIVINTIIKGIRTDQWKTKPENSISLTWHVNPLVIHSDRHVEAK